MLLISECWVYGVTYPTQNPPPAATTNQLGAELLMRARERQNLCGVWASRYSFIFLLKKQNKEIPRQKFWPRSSKVPLEIRSLNKSDDLGLCYQAMSELKSLVFKNNGPQLSVCFMTWPHCHLEWSPLASAGSLVSEVLCRSIVLFLSSTVSRRMWLLRELLASHLPEEERGGQEESSHLTCCYWV